MNLSLEFCARTDERYVLMRERHYVPSKGSHGQQVHFLVYLDRLQVGIISGGSSVYTVAARDRFFGIPAAKDAREKVWLPAIVNNTVFRLEQSHPNLGTQVLRLWRQAAAEVWSALYGVTVVGFETFVVGETWRQGSMYLADNWTRVGVTTGRTKEHTSAKGLSGSRAHLDTEPKITLCRWATKPRVPTAVLVPCWRRSTPEEKAASRLIASRRAGLLGRQWTREIGSLTGGLEAQRMSA